MLSRATKLDDLLLMRAPASDFLLRGPPRSLKDQLWKFARRTESNRRIAADIAQELGFTEFFH